MSSYDDLLQGFSSEDKKKDRLASSLSEAAVTNPDEFANMVKLSKAASISIESIPDYKNEAEQAKYLGEVGFSRLWKDAPKTSEFLSDPTNAKLARNDVPAMGFLERKIRSLGDGVVGLGGSALSGTGYTLDAMQRRILMGAASFLPKPMAGGEVTDESIVGQTMGDDWRYVAAPLKEASKAISVPKDQRDFGDDVMQAIGQIGGQFALGPLNLPTMFAQGVDMQAERSIKDNASQANKDWSMLGSGAWTMITEKVLGIDRWAKMGPLTSIKNPVGARVGGVGLAAASEGVQETLENVGQDALRKGLTNEDAAIGWGDAAYAGGVGATAAGVVRSFIESALHIKARRTQEFFTDLGDAAKQSELINRAPDKMSEFVAQAAQGGPVENVFIPSDQFVRYFQEVGADPVEAAQAMGVTNYTEAIAAGTDVIIPLGEFAARVAPSEHLQGLMPDLRLHQGDATARELMEMEADRDAREAYLKQQLESLIAEGETSRGLNLAIDRITQDVEGQLLGAGVEPSTARTQAQVMRGVAVLAQRAFPNEEPLAAAEKLWSQYGLTVNRELPPILTKLKNADVQLDPLLDRLRAAAMPSQAEVFGQPLHEFLRAMGGVKDQGGELSARDADVGNAPFVKNLIQAAGLDLDGAREMAAQMGFPVGESEADFISALTASFEGNPVYSPNQENPQALDLLQTLESLDKALKDSGVDLNAVDNATARKMLEQAGEVSGARFDQSVDAYQGDSIEVDGVLRSTLNSNGKPIAQTEEGLRNFWRWFGESKVVDAEGRPLVVYHGTRSEFDTFDYGRIGQQGRAEGAGFYFTTNKDIASGYGSPMEVYLAITKPMGYDQKGFGTSVLQKIVKRVAELESSAEGMDIGDGFLSNFGDTYSDGLNSVVKEAARLIASDETAVDQLSGIVGSGVNPEFVNAAVTEVTGYDGVVSDGFSNLGGTNDNKIFVALTNTQIKSATGNRGTFDPASPNILYQSANINGMADKDTVAGTQAPTSAGDGSKVGANVIAEQTTDWAKVGKVSVGDNGRVTVYHMKGFAPGRSEKDGVASSVMDAFRPALPEGQYWRFTNNKNELKHIKEGALLRSKNHADNSEEIGLSVAEGAHYGIQGYKYGYIVSGDVIGRGSDGEPLLDVEKLQPVSKLMPVADIVSKDRAERSELLKSRGWTNAQIADIANGTFKLEAKQNEPTASAGSDVLYQSVFHGSPHHFDKFSLDHLGNGEGNQAFGWGLYFAGKKQVAEFYRDALSSEAVFLDGVKVENLDSSTPEGGALSIVSGQGYEASRKRADSFMQEVEDAGGDVEWVKRWTEEIEKLKGRKVERRLDGQLYEANIPDDDEMLLWDKPITSQPAKVKQILKDSGLWKELKDNLSDFGSPQNTRGKLKGENIYAYLEWKLGSDEAASKRLDELGIPGLKYPAGTIAGVKNSGDNYVVWNEAAVEVLRTYYQSQDKKRGFLQIGANRQMQIGLTENSNLSTFLHETGHFYLEVMGDLAGNADAAQQVKDDYAAILKWMGVTDRSQIKTEQHEQFARANEAYLREGKAPAQELQGAFQRFKAWLSYLYRNLASMNVTLNDEVRAVFDRIYATDAEIDAASDKVDVAPMFLTAELMGMSPEEFALYRERVGKVSADAQDKLLTKLMREYERGRKEWWKEERANVREEVAAEVDAQPVYRAFAALVAGEFNGQPFKLNKADLVARFGEPYLKTLPRGFQRIYAGDGGIDVEMAAEVFGYATGEDLIKALVEMRNRKELIEAEADARMKERHGDMMTDGTAAVAAVEALHNDERANVLAVELRALLNMAQKDVAKQAKSEAAADQRSRVAATQMPNLSWFKSAAQGRLEQMVLRDINPNSYLIAGRRAAREAFAALARNDHQTAAAAKQRELLNHYLYLESVKAKADLDKIDQRFKKMLTGSDEKTAKSRDLDLVMAARAILADFGYGGKAKKAAAYLEKVKDYDPATHAVLMQSVEAAEELAASLPPNSKGPALRDLTTLQLRALADEVEALWFLAKRNRTMEIDGNLIDLQEIDDQLLSRLTDIGIPFRVAGEGYAITEGEMKIKDIRTFIASARRVEHWVDAIDGKEGENKIGLFRKYVWSPISDAAVAYRADKAKFLRKFRESFKSIEETLKPKIIAADELGYVFGKDSGGSAMNEILHAILHTGNESNKRKLLLGRNWATLREDGSLDTSRWDSFVSRMISEGNITKAHYDFAQSIWDLLESMKPMAQKTHREVFGKYFDEVTAQEFVTPFGIYRGGYVPAMADSRIVSDAAMRDLQEQENQAMSFAFPTTSKGFTKARTEYNRPLMLDMRSLAQHIDKVLMFSRMEIPVRDVRKALGKEAGQALARIDPTIIGGMITPWLNRAAKQQVETPISGAGRLMRFFSVIRSRAGAAAMFGNLVNTAQQITGFSLAALKVKPSLMLSSTADYMKHPGKFTKAVSEASPYMATRMENEVAAMSGEINDILLNPSMLEQGQNWAMKHAYFMQSAVDNVMSPIIWTAAYNQAIEGGNDHKDAVRLADAAVRQTQGSTQPEDISRIEGGNAFVRMFTQFAGYFNMQANLLGAQFITLSRDYGLMNSKGRAFFIFTAGFLIPAMISEVIVQAFRGGPDDEDKDGEYLDDWLSALFMGSVRTATAMVPVVGQGVMSVINASNSKPYDDRLATPPAISMLESAARAPFSATKAINGEGSNQKAVRDVATLVSMTLGIPVNVAAKPIGYASGVSDGRILPTSNADMVRGLITGVASADSKR